MECSDQAWQLSQRVEILRRLRLNLAQEYRGSLLDSITSQKNSHSQTQQSNKERSSDIGQVTFAEVVSWDRDSVSEKAEAARREAARLEKTEKGGQAEEAKRLHDAEEVLVKARAKAEMDSADHVPKAETLQEGMFHSIPVVVNEDTFQDEVVPFPGAINAIPAHDNAGAHLRQSTALEVAELSSCMGETRASDSMTTVQSSSNVCVRIGLQSGSNLDVAKAHDIVTTLNDQLYDPDSPLRQGRLGSSISSMSLRIGGEERDAIQALNEPLPLHLPLHLYIRPRPLHPPSFPAHQDAQQAEDSKRAVDYSNEKITCGDEGRQQEADKILAGKGLAIAPIEEESENEIGRQNADRALGNVLPIAPFDQQSE